MLTLTFVVLVPCKSVLHSGHFQLRAAMFCAGRHPGVNDPVVFKNKKTHPRGARIRGLKAWLRSLWEAGEDVLAQPNIIQIFVVFAATMYALVCVAGK